MRIHNSLSNHAQSLHLLAPPLRKCPLQHYCSHASVKISRPCSPTRLHRAPLHNLRQQNSDSSDNKPCSRSRSTRNHTSRRTSNDCHHHALLLHSSFPLDTRRMARSSKRTLGTWQRGIFLVRSPDIPLFSLSTCRHL